MAEKSDALLPGAHGFTLFDEDNEKYRCCCGGKCHSRTGTLIIGVVGLFFAVSALIIDLVRNALYSKNYYSVIGVVCGDALAILVISLLIHGVRKEKCVLLIPHMVFQILAIIGLAIVILLVFLMLVGVSITGIVKTEEDKQAEAIDYHTFVSLSVALIIIFLLILILYIWFFVIVLKCYRYLRDKRLVFLPTV